MTTSLSPAIIITGKRVDRPTAQVNEVTVISTGRWLKLASIYNEEVVAGNPVENPDRFVTCLQDTRLPADIFSFAQRPPVPTPLYDHYYEYDNFAAIPISTYDHWLTRQIGTDVRQNVKKAPKRGVTASVAEFNDHLIKGISEIYNETPIRQGRIFWHYNKSHDQIRLEAGRYLERSDFIGAYFDGELIGFIKMTYTDQFADLGLIVTKQSHYEKRAPNALLAKAVEVCAQRGVRFLRYDKMSYGKKSSTSLADFKRRNGFVEFRFPRYYLPLTLRGRIALKMGLHRQLQDILPETVQNLVLRLRTAWYQRFVLKGKPLSS
jgi:hypothetical protein